MIASAVVTVAMAAILVGGCTTATGEKPAAPMATTQPAAKSSMPASATTASDVQVCYQCDTGKMPASVTGKPVIESGVQVINITIKGGTYVPNVIAVKAGMPVKVVFTGKAKGCLAKPTFKDLGKTIDLTGMGGGTLDLGALKAGTHKFTCSMGMNAGTITAS